MQVTARGKDEWYLDSGCSRHMTGDRSKFLSLVDHRSGNVTFGDNKKGKIIAVGKIGISESFSINIVYLVQNLMHVIS